MKYSELLQFNPIEDVIQLTSANDSNKAIEYVKTYVMSDTMANNLKPTVLDQLQMDEVIDNKGVLIVGNYGTGKSHLMSVISSIAKDKDNLDYVQNQNFKDAAKCIAGKFEVLRLEIGGVTMPLREIIMGEVEEDLNNRGIDYEMPDFKQVRDNKRVLNDMMVAFATKYPEKGYLIVVDEFLSYLTTRNQAQLTLDLEFLRAMGEMCSKSKLRIIFGVQEKIFDNPKFSYVSDTLKKVSDRFTQLVITKESTAFVVSERILKKTAEQKAIIRKHLEQFSHLYAGMSSRMDEFVDLYPIHPSYIDVFNKIYLIENRHILKNISVTIKDLFNKEVPENAPGIISFDDYWRAIKSNGMLKSDVTISRVVNASGQLEEIVNRSFPKAHYKSTAIKIIYALSVHRLTTNGLDVKTGLTAENLKDDLCIYLPIPEQDSEFLLAIIKQTLKDIVTTVSGQFIIFNESNSQYYIDVDKTVDYDEKIKQRASLVTNDELNRSFYKIVYGCLEWRAKQYVTNFDIYEYDLNWDSHNYYRAGYLFLGQPAERSTAQPVRDFYIHIMPPYGDDIATVENLDDEVYFYFKSSEDFKEDLANFAAANSLSEISEGNEKDAYDTKASNTRRKLIRYLSENKNTCFTVSYKKMTKQLIEVLKGRYNKDLNFKDTIDLASSLCLEDYFDNKYPLFPKMNIKITRANEKDIFDDARFYFGGRRTKQITDVFASVNLLNGDKIDVTNSEYAMYYVNQLKDMPSQGVVNFSDIFDHIYMDEYVDKKFGMNTRFMSIILLSLVYSGYANMTLKNGEQLNVGNVDAAGKKMSYDILEFKYISNPTEMSLAELKHMFDVLGLNSAKLDQEKTREKAIEDLLSAAQRACGLAVNSGRKIDDSFSLWGEDLVPSLLKQNMSNACHIINNEFSNYSAKYNTVARLHNFKHTMAEVDGIKKNLEFVQLIPEYVTFKTNCLENVNYISQIEGFTTGLEKDIEEAKEFFRNRRDSIASGTRGETAADKVNKVLETIKNKYIDIYFEAHKKKRLDITDAKRKGEIQQGALFANLKKLKGIDILSTSKCDQIENDLSNLNICISLTPTDLKNSPICPHCKFKLDEQSKNVYGQLENIESRIDDLIEEYTNNLYDAVSDPLVKDQEKFLSKEQQKVINDFIATKKFPKRVDDFFVKSIEAMLKGFKPVVISASELSNKLSSIGPCDIDTFKKKIDEIVSSYTDGTSDNSIRIIVKND